MSNVIPPNPTQGILNPLGLMNHVFRAWTQLVSARIDQNTPLTGTGSPETVVEATQGRLYIDTSGITATTLYVKQVDDIAGDKSAGWILV